MAAIPKLVRKTVLAVKQESTQGSAATIGATDFLLAEDVTIKPVVDLIERNYYRSTIDTLPTVTGKATYEVSFKTELKGSGSAGTAYAPLGAAIQACGFTETVNAGTNVIYAPTSAAVTNYYGPGKSVTIEVFMDGVKHQVVGCIGTFKTTMTAAKLVMFEFSFKGMYANPADTAPGTQTYNSLTPPTLISSSLSVQSLNAVCEKFEIDCGNEIAERADTRAATGIQGFMITGRKPVGSFDPEMETVATHSFFAILILGTNGTASLTVGSAAGNTIAFSLPGCQYADVSYGDRNAIRTVDVPLRFNQSSGDDWLTMTFT